MGKAKTYDIKPEKNRRTIIRIDIREVEKKIRKPHAPPTKTHASKKRYRRKPKHPKQEGE